MGGEGGMWGKEGVPGGVGVGESECWWEWLLVGGDEY